MEVLVGMSRNADRSMADNFRPVVAGMTRGGGRFVSVPDGVTASVPCGADGVLCGSLVAVGPSKTSSLWPKEYSNITGRLSGL